MTKKDYIKIAAILQQRGADRPIIDDFASMLAADNPQFDRDRFLVACGVTALDLPWAGVQKRLRRQATLLRQG